MPKEWKEYNKISDKKNKKIKLLNDLPGSKWAQMSKSVQKFNGGIAKKRREHGAAYPISLVKHFIEIFSKEGDVVLDPFLGVGTTLDAASLLGRHGIGFEINEKFIKLAKNGIEDIDKSDVDFKGQTEHKIIPESCFNIPNHVKRNSIDLIVTSPPYSNLLNNTLEKFGGSDYKKNIYKESKRKLAKPYSTNEEDLGNQTWKKYCDSIGKIMKLLHNVAKEGSYNVWVVKDFRDMKEGFPYVNLHGKIIELATKKGWILIDVVIWDQSDQRKLVKLGGPKARRFYFNIGHSFILIFRKNISGERFSNAK